MIRYTGNPYVDAGLAVIELRLKKPCAAFSDDDLRAQAAQVEAEYNRSIWRSYLTTHFPNSAWVQPRISPEKKREYVRKVLASYLLEPLAPTRGCVFCARPAQTVIDRSHFPLLTGETIMVAGAGAEPGLPVCGFCIFAVQFYPLATLKVAGRPLFWWAPEPEWTRLLTRRFLRDAQRVLAASSDQFLNLRWPSTQLLRAARGAMDDLENPAEWLSKEERPALCDIVGIHATNYGSGPDYDELRIPRNLLEFWSEARSSFGPLYQRIENDAWETEAKPAKSNKQNASGSSPVPELARRNRLYEALGQAFRSPDFRREAKSIAANFFLRSNGKSVEPNSIALAEFFLEKVAGMEKARLEAIREMADSIADNLILSNRDRRAAGQLFRRRLKTGELLQCLSQVQRKLSDAGRPFTWDRVLLALGLASEEDRTPTDSWLVQELMLFRLYERLAQSEILAELPELQAEEASADVSTVR